MKSLPVTVLLMVAFAFGSGCISSVKSTIDRSRGDTAFYGGKNYVDAEKFYRAAANNGDADAAYMHSRILLDRKYGVQSVGEGLNRLNQAAAAGHVLANRDLGVYYMTGKHGLERSVPRSLPYFEMAAAKNDEFSVMALATIYGSGLGVQKNPVQASRWFAKGRELGLPIPADMSNPEVIAALKPLPEGRKSASSPVGAGAKLVQEAQSLLTKLGYNPGPADGIAGKKTRQAVREFQEKRNLKVTGEIDGQLVRELESALANN